MSIEYNDSSVYEGPWIEDPTYHVVTTPFKTVAVQGHWGKFTRPNGDIWEGDEVTNAFNPKIACGEFTVTLYVQSCVYQGTVLNGKWHGFGIMKIKSGLVPGQYIGEWKDGVRDGKGLEVYEDGESYNGTWYNNVYHGNGTVVYNDSSAYTGDMYHGQWHGAGRRTLPSKDILVGTFFQGGLHSNGECIFHDGRHYTGGFKDTLKSGDGILTYPSGDRYEGPFENGVEHGKATFYTRTSVAEGAEPCTRIGLWDEGVLVKWITREITKLGTTTFVEYFGPITITDGTSEWNRNLASFRTPYAVMVASGLPVLPAGVDPDDEYVVAIIQQLARSQHLVLGSGSLHKTQDQLRKVSKKIFQLEDKVLEFTNRLYMQRQSVREQERILVEANIEMECMEDKESELQYKIETFWKNDPRVGHYLEFVY